MCVCVFFCVCVCVLVGFWGFIEPRYEVEAVLLHENMKQQGLKVNKRVSFDFSIYIFSFECCLI